MKNSIILRLLLLVSLAGTGAKSVCQTGVWNYIAHAQVSHGFGAAVTGPDGRIYVFGGAHNEVYDPSSDTWSTIADDSVTSTSEFDAVLGSNGKIYAFGGAPSGEDVFLDAAVYDPSNNSWSPIASLPNNMYGNLAILGTDGKIYAVAPKNGALGGYILIYDPATDTWATDPNVLPSGLEANSMGAVGPDGKLYICGGSDLSGPVGNSAFSYDPHSDAWLQLPSMPHTQDIGGAAWAGDGRLYVISGNSVSDLSNQLGPDPGVQVYDPVSNSWSIGPNLNLPRAFAPTVEAQDGSIYVMTGFQLLIGSTTTAERLAVNQLSVRVNNISLIEGTKFNGAVATIVDHRSGQAAGDFSAIIDWGDGTVDTGVVAAGNQAGTFTVSGSHTYAEAGVFVTKVSVDDTDAESATGSGQAAIGDDLITGHSLDFTASRNVNFNGKVGSFTDGNGLSTASDFTGSISWGDAATSAASISANPSGGFDIGGSHTYLLSGVFTVTIDIIDAHGSNAIFLSHCTVSPGSPQVAANTISATEGVAFSGQVAHLTDPDPAVSAGSFTASINWGDGSTTSGTVASDGAGGFNVGGGHTYAEEGSFTTTVTVSVSGGGSSTSSASATVADAPLTGTGYKIIGKYRSFSGVVATFKDGDPAGVVGDYQATILWGDGGSSVGVIKAAGGSFSVSGSHNYQKKLVFTVQVLIADTGGASTTVTSTIDMTKAR